MAKKTTPVQPVETTQVIKVEKDKRDHEVRMYSQEGVLYVEKNDNGCVHPVACVNKAEAAQLFKQYCEAD